MKVFWVLLDQKRRFVHIYSQVAFSMISGSEFGCLGLQKQAFGKFGIAKMSFRRNWISYDSRFNFARFWVALGPVFMTVVTLGNGLKFDDFS